MGYKKKVDDNQAEIVEAFRNNGATVAVTSTIGQGYPDISVGMEGITIIGKADDFLRRYLRRKNITYVENATILVEIKGEKGKLTKSQNKFVSEWKGNFLIIRTVEEVDELC